MTIGLHEFLRELHREGTAAYLTDPHEKAPGLVTLSPATFEDVLLDVDDPWSPGRPTWPGADGRPQVFGIDLEEDRALPVDVAVIRWQSGRLVVLRKLETTQWRATVRDGVARAHPWLRLPEPVPHADPEKRWVRWTFPAPSRLGRLWEQRIGLQVTGPRAMVAGFLGGH